MANCVQCGRELPSFSFGDQTDVCRECRAQAQSEAEVHRDSSPEKPAEVDAQGPPKGFLSMARMFPVTSAIVALNTAVYLVCAAISLKTGRGSPMDFDTEMLVRWGADYGPLTFGGQYWRVLSSCFLHGGLIHIAANMYCFWDFGRIAERVYGELRYLSIYVLTGIAASLASLAIHPSNVSVGASGAIFGVAGALVLPFYSKRLQLPAPAMKAMLRSLGTFIVINLFIGAAVPVIDNSAHIGGLLFGLALGALWTWLRVAPQELNSTVLKVTAVGLILCGVAFVGLQRLHADRFLAEQALFDLERGDLDSATRRARRAIETRPKDPVPHIALAEVYFRKSQFADAAREYRAALDLKPGNGYSLAQLGASYVALNQWSEAEPPLREALKQQPNDAEVLLNLGITLAATNRTDEALQQLRKSVQIDPASARAQFTLGRLLLETGENQQAMGALQEAVRLAPNDEVYRKTLREAESRVTN